MGGSGAAAAGAARAVVGPDDSRELCKSWKTEKYRSEIQIVFGHLGA